MDGVSQPPDLIKLTHTAKAAKYLGVNVTGILGVLPKGKKMSVTFPQNREICSVDFFCQNLRSYIFPVVRIKNDDIINIKIGGVSDVYDSFAHR